MVLKVIFPASDEIYRSIAGGLILRLDARQNLPVLPVHLRNSSSTAVPPSDNQSRIRRAWSASKGSLTPAKHGVAASNCMPVL
jgi:hypothetical protein